MSAAPVAQDIPTDTALSSSDSLSDMFRPPVNRAMRVLDRSFFRKTVPLSAATVLENKNISRVKNELMKSKDMLDMPRIIPVQKLQTINNEGDEKRKCLLLREGIKADGMSAAPRFDFAAAVGWERYADGAG